MPVNEISIRNALGEKVYTQRDVNSSASMDLSTCGPGLYFLEMRFTNGENYVFRVVKIWVSFLVAKLRNARRQTPDTQTPDSWCGNNCLMMLNPASVEHLQYTLFNE